MSTPPINPGVRIGHVHLKVADIDRALAFYCGVLGFELTQRIGKQAAFISAGGYHHHIGLNTWESRGGSPPAPGTTGLYHLAILYPTRAQLADALRRLIEANIPLEGASDHGVSEALYLRDPDDNGVELYWDRPQAEWAAHRRRRTRDVHAPPRSGGLVERGRDGAAGGDVEHDPEKHALGLDPRVGTGFRTRSCSAKRSNRLRRQYPEFRSACRTWRNPTQ